MYGQVCIMHNVCLFMFLCCYLFVHCKKKPALRCLARGYQRTNCKLETANGKRQTANGKLQTANWKANLRLEARSTTHETETPQ